jgi:RAB protein geranylgeranyltransferase component A
VYVCTQLVCISSALSKAGFRVAHIDSNSFYGADEASLSVDELTSWAENRASDKLAASSAYFSNQRRRFTSIRCSSESLPQSRQYSLSLSPSIIPSLGPLISSLVSSGVARYGGFRLLERVGIYHPSGQIGLVPSSKEDVFKNKDLSLVEKRRLMRFLIFAAGEFEESNEITGKESQPIIDFLRQTFSLNDEIAETITYSVAFCASSSGQRPFLRFYVLPAVDISFKNRRFRLFSASDGTCDPQAGTVLPHSSSVITVDQAKSHKGFVGPLRCTVVLIFLVEE